MNDSLTQLYTAAGNSCYGGLALVALWGLYCIVVVWRRTAQIRFRTEAEQAAFLVQIDAALAAGNFDGAAQLCEGNPKAMAQLVLLAIRNRDLGYAKVRHLVADLFQRDVLADLEHRISWIYTVIKTAPMLGLFGTVLGMMAAFGKLYSEGNVEAKNLAGDISLALITTAIGLAIAIPLTLGVASINIRMRKLEDLVGFGLTRFLDSFKSALPE